MVHRPTWIQILIKRSHAGHALHSAFLLDLACQSIAEYADAEPNGRGELRQFALGEAQSADVEMAALALVFLSVAGVPADLAFAQGFVKHPSDLVRRAARTCCYELRQRSLE